MAPKGKKAARRATDACKSKKEVREKIVLALEHFFGGSGDLEQEDAKDIVAFFSEELASSEKQKEFKQAMIKIECCLRKIDVNWQPEEVLERIPNPEATMTTCTLAPWQLGFQAKHSLKGKSKMVAITDIAVQFLESPFQSAASPLQVMMPFDGPVGTVLDDYSVVHSVGFGKSCATKALFFVLGKMFEPAGLAVLQPDGPDLVLTVDEADIRFIKDELQALLRLRCVIGAATSMADAINNALTTKMQAAERQRADPVQILTAFTNRAIAEGKSIDKATLQGYFDEFDSSTVVEAKKFTPAEIKATKWLVGLNANARSKVEYHWDQYRVEHSAIPLNVVEGCLDAEDASPRDPGNEVFAGIYKVTPEKIEAMLLRRIGIFVSRLKAQARLTTRPICAVVRLYVAFVG